MMMIAALCMLTAANAQTVTKDSLSVVKPGSKMRLDVDFSHAVIMGMDEEAFSKYETDWQTDKPTVVTRLMNGVNMKLDGVLKVKQLSSMEYTLKVTVRDVTNQGFITCDAEVTDQAGRTLFAVKQVTGGVEPPFSPGTKLAKMKFWSLLTGRSLGGIIRSVYLGE